MYQCMCLCNDCTIDILLNDDIVTIIITYRA